MELSESEILELPLRSVNYVSRRDRVIGQTPGMLRIKKGRGYDQRSVAYEKPNGERFRIIKRERGR